MVHFLNRSVLCKKRADLDKSCELLREQKREDQWWIIFHYPIILYNFFICPLNYNKTV